MCLDSELVKFSIADAVVLDDAPAVCMGEKNSLVRRAVTAVHCAFLPFLCIRMPGLRYNTIDEMGVVLFKIVEDAPGFKLDLAALIGGKVGDIG